MSDNDEQPELTELPQFSYHEIPLLFHVPAMMLRDCGVAVTDEEWLTDCRAYNQWLRDNRRDSEQIDEADVALPTPSSPLDGLIASISAAIDRAILAGKDTTIEVNLP